MGAICRMYATDKIKELFKEEIEDATVCIELDGGIPHFIHRENEDSKNHEVIAKEDITVIIIDADAVDEYSSAQLTREIVESHGAFKYM